MEPEIRAYFIRIVNTIAVILLWMIINITAGIQFGLAFVNDRLTAGNILFYCWFLLSLIGLIIYLIKKWQKPLNIPH